MVARGVWDAEVASSNLVAPTRIFAFSGARFLFLRVWRAILAIFAKSFRRITEPKPNGSEQDVRENSERLIQQAANRNPKVATPVVAGNDAIVAEDGVHSVVAIVGAS